MPCASQSNEMTLCSFCKPCVCVAIKNSAKIHRNSRGLRRKTTRIFGAQRTAPSKNSSCLLRAVVTDLRLTLRMFCNHRACVSRRFCMESAANSRGFREKIEKFPRGTSAKRAAQAQKQCLDVSCATQINADAFAQILQAMHARCAQKM